MKVQMKSFYFHSEHEINETLKYYEVNYLENAFVFKTKDMYIPPDFSQSNKDVLCIIGYINPFKIQCNSCFTFNDNCKTLSGIVFDHVENEEGIKMSSLIHNLSRNDRIIVFNGFFTKIFGVPHLVIRPREKYISVFHFKFTMNPLLLKTTDNVHFKLSDKEIYSLLGRVIDLKKDTNEDNIYLTVECYNFQSNNLLIYKSKNFSQEEIISMSKCNCFFDFIEIIVNEPNIDFNLLVPGQQIQLNNVKVNLSSSFGMYSLYVKGEPENLSVVPKISVLLDQEQNITPNELKPETSPEADKYQNINTTSIVQRQNPSPNELIPEILSEVDQNQEIISTLELHIPYNSSSEIA